MKRSTKILSLLLSLVLLFACAVPAFAEVAPHPHEWSDYETVREATCYSQGLKVRTCGVCGAKEYETVPLTDHPADYQIVYGAHSPCNYTGDKVCRVCGKTVEKGVERVPAVHTPDPAQKRSVPVTCTADGYDEIVCAVCGTTYRDNVVKTHGHVDENEDAVCDRCGADVAFPGSPTEVCPVCGRVHNLNLWDRLVGFGHTLWLFWNNIYVKLQEAFPALF